MFIDHVIELKFSSTEEKMEDMISGLIVAQLILHFSADYIESSWFCPQGATVGLDDGVVWMWLRLDL